MQPTLRISSSPDLVTAAARYAFRLSRSLPPGSPPLPYFTHLAEVAGLLEIATRGMDESLIAAGYLHTLLDDCGVPLDALREQFGEDVAGLVLGVSDPGLTPVPELRRRQAETFALKPLRVRMLMLASRISALRALHLDPAPGLTKEQHAAELAWAETIGFTCLGVNRYLDDQYRLELNAARFKPN